MKSARCERREYRFNFLNFDPSFLIALSKVLIIIVCHNIIYSENSNSNNFKFMILDIFHNQWAMRVKNKEKLGRPQT